MEHRFDCTACGKCCYGVLPLTLRDAVLHIGRFPLAMMWTTVRQGAKSFALTQRLGLTVTLGKQKKIAVQITPISYLPATMACPELTANRQCGIHHNKPIRCRTMPFYAYRNEQDQADLMIPRKGWECDVSNQAPVVYKQKKIVNIDNFSAERQALVEQTPILRAYAKTLLENAPNVQGAIEIANRKKQGGHVILNFSAIVSRIPDLDMATFARHQEPVLRAHAQKTQKLAGADDFHRYFADNVQAMQRYLDRT